MTLVASAPGENSLTTLLKTLTMTLDPCTYVFLTFPPKKSPSPLLLDNAQMTFHESEGITLVALRDLVQTMGITDYQFSCRMITCNVHSSLEAVGFMAAITKKLTEAGIGANPVSGFFHDHLFVPEGKETEAIKALEEMVEEAKVKVRGGGS